MATIEQTSKEYFKGNTTLFTALLIGQVLIAAILYYIAEGEKTTGFDTSDVYSFIVPIMALIGFLGSSFVFRRALKKAKALKDLKDKLGAYRGALIAKWALIEAAVLISVLAFYLTNNLTYLIMGGAMILYFTTHKPSMRKTIEDLSLNHNEQSLIQRPDEIIARIPTK